MSYKAISVMIAIIIPADEQILALSIHLHLLFSNPIIIGSALVRAKNYKIPVYPNPKRCAMLKLYNLLLPKH